MTGTVQSTYLPDEHGKVAAVHDFLAAREARQGTAVPDRFLLIGSGLGEQVEIPEQMYQILRQVVEAMFENKAITVIPQDTMLTTQQAAEMLGMSRPTLVKLLELGRIPFQRVGTHRRVRLVDLITYRDAAREAKFDMIAETGGDDTPMEEVLRLTREARIELAKHGRQQGQA